MIGEGGKDCTGKAIPLDQFKRKHPTDKICIHMGGTDRTAETTDPRGLLRKTGTDGTFPNFPSGKTETSLCLQFPPVAAKIGPFRLSAVAF